MKTYQSIASLYLRFALGAGFLSAVADRFGYWGEPGAANVAWGAWEPFVAYTGTLTPFVSPQITEVLAALATAAEIILGILLIIGLFTRTAALGAGILTALFALSMTIAISVKAPLDYSVFAFSAAGFLLATLPTYPYSVDNWLAKRKESKPLVSGR